MASMTSLGVTLSRRRRRKSTTLRKMPVVREAKRGRRIRMMIPGLMPPFIIISRTFSNGLVMEISYSFGGD
jgi:hypothetical protein